MIRERSHLIAAKRSAELVEARSHLEEVLMAEAADRRSALGMLTMTERRPTRFFWRSVQDDPCRQTAA